MNEKEQKIILGNTVYNNSTMNLRRRCDRGLSPSLVRALAPLLLLLSPGVGGFSLDPTNPQALQPPQEYRNNSMFGYTLAALSSSPDQQILLVGAPQSSSSQVEVAHPGALYSCTVTDRKCRRLSVDISNRGDNYLNTSNTVDVKDNQRLGAALAVEGTAAVVCAPNWHYTQKNRHNEHVGTPVGKCFYTEDGNLNNFQPFSPVIDINTNNDILFYFTDGYCQAGVSAAIDGKTKEVVLGAPGCNAWWGDAFSGQATGSTYKRRGKDYVMADFIEGEDKKQTMIPNERYFGFSVAVGKFKNTNAMVVSSPRATVVQHERTTNAVTSVVRPSIAIMMNHNETALKTWLTVYPPNTEEWMFSYFGYSVAVGDVNSDGHDDIVVGCPTYDGDRGAVLVYYQTERDGEYQMAMEKLSSLRQGSEKGDRFGTSVTVLDDIDGDGHKEVAVGAPFAQGGLGRLYIYCGEQGRLPDHSCQSLETNEGAIRGLGWAVTTVDGGLAVSAPATEHVLVYSTLTVLQLNTTLETGKELDITSWCVLTTGGGSYPCTDIQVCVRYTLRNGVADQTQREFSVSVTLDTGRVNSKLQFEDSGRQTDVLVRAVPGRQECKSRRVYDTSETEWITEYKINASSTYNPDQDSGKKVVVDRRNGGDYAAGLLRVHVECEGGVTNECNSSITMTGAALETYVYGVSKDVKIQMIVSNGGEPAYYPKLSINTDGDLEMSGKPSIEGGDGSCETEDQQADGQQQAALCSFGAVLAKDAERKLTFSFTPSQAFMNDVENAKNMFNITAEFTTSSLIVDPSQAKSVIHVDINVEPEVHLSGLSSPEEVDLGQWDPSNGTSALERLGPAVSHRYQLTNSNEYKVYGTHITVKWPYKHYTDSGEAQYLLYVSSAPVITVEERRVGTCTAEGGVFDELGLAAGIAGGARRRRGAQQDAGPLNINCSIGDLNPTTTADVTILSRAVSSTLTQMEGDARKYVLESTATAVVDHVPFGVKYRQLDSGAITSIIYPEPAGALPMWAVIVMSVVGGLVLVVVCGLIAWKLLRKKPAGTDHTDGGDVDAREEIVLVKGADQESAEEGEQADEKMELAGASSI